ncbi:similar to Saccharomyces cerevisiae YMR034C Putative transporter, member of the SLC10 carrier family [Maudiozyma barnettii]|uniref:Similar to Saccharomyces cerevisiae YMR034C Putative transporter, member of the SLC10 carrier family n=1 Tax=Maudiozyma barnettii TaxID=61262 RepID=A0A8H2VKE5_9SACH|nr:Rch1p [Kazachstania barnettii]CAB4256920.1 similar to Saccharomyces cerevisiae YMR034C Putative transporter, member of the SLC10 carrier family [Kazachstania barnettii]CAD1785525.1 similar to Saccharomyces cerevisiae YMR034C Putative transporter, member of the SLC10 carrier family [Kazachstania barnettii]
MIFSSTNFKYLWHHPVTKIIKSFWFFYCLAIFIVIARFAPNFARDGGLIKGQYSIGYGAVAWIFLQSGLSMSTKKILANISNWRAHLTIATMSFLITSSIVYGFCVAIIKSNDNNIDKWVLMGIITTITCPTTVASNVIMTHDANGNDLLCVCEVVLGNLFGAFITPALVQMYTSNDLFSFGDPSSGGSISALYGRVMKQVGLSVFVPLFVGQCIQNVFPKQTSAYIGFLKKYNIKIGSYMLLLIMFSSFSTAFYQKSFTSVSHICIVFVCLFNLGVYLFFTLVSFCIARPFFLLKLFPEDPVKGKCSNLYYYSYKVFRPFYYNKKDTICIMYCAPAKTAALGVSLITSQYGNHKEHLGKLLVPLVLYQGEQVLTANFFVPILKRWVKDEIEQDKLREQEEADDEKTLSGTSDLEKLPTTDIDRQTVSSSESSTV